MDEFISLLGWIGVFSPVAFGAIGSVLGCAFAGQAAVGALLDTETNYGRFIGLSVLPSTFIIYGIVLMFSLQAQLSPTSAGGIFAVGTLSGIALLMTALWQGKLCISAINAVKEKPEIFGLSVTPVAIIEGFGVFVFIFALVVSSEIS